MKTQHQLRYARPEDVEVIIELCAAHAAYEQSDYDKTGKIEQFSKHLFGEENTLKCLVVEQDNQIIGYSTFMKQFCTWSAAFYIYMDCLYLTEAARNKGIGQEIMDFIQAYASKNDCCGIQWQTPTFNVGAIRFYHRVGAISKSKERFFWNF